MVTIRWLREQIRQGKTIYDLPLRVTFYARVSTEKVEQQGSLENQIQYYTSSFKRTRIGRMFLATLMKVFPERALISVTVFCA